MYGTNHYLHQAIEAEKETKAFVRKLEKKAAIGDSLTLQEALELSLDRYVGPDNIKDVLTRTLWRNQKGDEE